MDVLPSRRVRIVEGLRTVRTVERNVRLPKALRAELQGVEVRVEIETLADILFLAMTEITVMLDEMTGNHILKTLINITPKPYMSEEDQNQKISSAQLSFQQ